MAAQRSPSPPIPCPTQGTGLRAGLPLLGREASWAASREGSLRGGVRAWSGEGLDKLAAAAGMPLPTPPRPVLAYTGRSHCLLERRCQEALAILERVQQPAAPRRGRGAAAGAGEVPPQLPKTAFRFAKAGREGCRFRGNSLRVVWHE